MKYIATVFLLMLLSYILSFARYNWKNNNWIAAIGSAVLGFAAFGISFILIFFGSYEM
jgi:hypothetical protein